MRPADRRSGRAARDVFERDGMLVRLGVFEAAELGALVEHFSATHRAQPGAVPTRAREGTTALAADWQRILEPHRVDATARRLLLDPRLMASVAELAGEPVFGLQTMWYWKPPGSLGQALHCDEQYVRSVGGRCVGAWLAVDRSDRGNGCLSVVRGSHRVMVRSTRAADPARSFSRRELVVPDGLTPEPVEMNPGDVLFFDGRLIHGSEPNHSEDRWRRAFAAHYLPRSVASCAREYWPLLDGDGRAVRPGEL